MHADEQQCEVCRGAAAKYKCPRCRLKYCSIGCYKNHQSQPCQPADAPLRPEVEDAETRISKQQVLFPTDDTVPPSTLEKLRECDRLKALLGNPHLREMLGEVDGAVNAQTVMRRAMMEPLFNEFADAVLAIVEPDLEAAAAPPAKKGREANLDLSDEWTDVLVKLKSGLPRLRSHQAEVMQVAGARVAMAVVVVVVVVAAAAVVRAAPHHSPARQLRAADGTPKGYGGGEVLTGAAERRGRRRVGTVDGEECDEWELLLSPPRKRPHQQAATDDKTNKREALEIDVGTGIIVQSGATTRRPYSFPQNPSFNPNRPYTTTQRPIILPDAGPQLTPSPPANQPPPTIFNSPFFPANLFPSSGSRPLSPDGGFPSVNTPRPAPPNNPPLGSISPSGVFPGQSSPDFLFPGLPTARPSFPIPPNQGPDYVHPTTHRPKFPGFFSAFSTTRKPCSCRNRTAVTTPPPPVFLTPTPIGSPVSPAPPQFPVPTPGVLRPIPVGPPVTQRPQFLGSIPRDPRPPSPLAPSTSPRPQFPSFVPTAPRPPSALAPPVSPRPPFQSLTPNAQRPFTPGGGGFGSTIRPNFNPVASFPVFPNTQPRPVIIVPYRPQGVNINTRPSTTNFLQPRFPPRLPSNGQVIPGSSPNRVYFRRASHQAPKEPVQLEETTEK